MATSKNSPMKKSIGRAEARNEAWRRGRFALNYLRPSQYKVFEFIREHNRPFIEAARRWGKTTSILGHVFEALNKNANWISRICLPEKEQARKVWMPEIDKMQKWAPDTLRMQFRTIDTVYLHPNGSKGYLHGINDDKGVGARGSAAHLVVADEYGFFRYPEAVREVLAPQVRTTGGKIIIASTPPPDLGHSYYIEKEIALKEGRFIQRTIYDDETLFDKAGVCIQPEVFEQIVKDCGGINSSIFRREYLCEPVADEESLVVPEFKESIHVFDERPRPPFFDFYVGCDLGFKDKTALLFGYYDFEAVTLVIEDELVVSGWNSKQITDKAKEIEGALYPTRRPYLRVSDNDVQQLHDMATMCEYQLVPTRKDDKEAAINDLRLRFAEQKGKIRINSRCKSLIYQLKVGMWNEAKRDYLRGTETGHLDCIDALIYLNRNINITKNPFPAPTYDLGNHYINHEHQKPVPDDTQGLESLLPFRGTSGI